MSVQEDRSLLPFEEMSEIPAMQNFNHQKTHVQQSAVHSTEHPVQQINCAGTTAFSTFPTLQQQEKTKVARNSNFFNLGVDFHQKSAPPIFSSFGDLGASDLSRHKIKNASDLLRLKCGKKFQNTIEMMRRKKKPRRDSADEEMSVLTEAKSCMVLGGNIFERDDEEKEKSSKSKSKSKKRTRFQDDDDEEDY